MRGCAKTLGTIKGTVVRALRQFFVADKLTKSNLAERPLSDVSNMSIGNNNINNNARQKA